MFTLFLNFKKYFFEKLLFYMIFIRFKFIKIKKKFLYNINNYILLKFFFILFIYIYLKNFIINIESNLIFYLFIINFFTLLYIILYFNLITMPALFYLIFFNLLFFNIFNHNLLYFFFFKNFIFHKSTLLLSQINLLLLNHKSYFILNLDYYNFFFIYLTLNIGFYTLIYSFYYMRNEKRSFIFIIFMYFFLLSMVLLLLAGSFLIFLFSWELIGVFSFLLINFWNNRISTLKSAFKAIFFNKLSDFFLLIVFLFILIYYPENIYFTFNSPYTLTNTYIYVFNFKIYISQVFLIFLTLTSFCKSAQLGFHIWLPDSMEAPTPASALIHSATLVSAGLYLFGRYNFIYIHLELWYFIFFWSSLTSLYGTIVASMQNDLKKILAYSTISHCGIMFTILCLNNYLVFFLYLLSHGFFKSFSFMLVGNIINEFKYQDLNKLNSVNNNTFFIKYFLIFSLLGLSATPFFLGFFFKFFFFKIFFNNLTLTLSSLFIITSTIGGFFYSANIIYNFLYSFEKNIKQNSNYLFIYTKNNFNKLDDFFLKKKKNFLYYLFFVYHLNIFIVLFFLNYFIFLEELNNINNIFFYIINFYIILVFFMYFYEKTFIILLFLILNNTLYLIF